MVRQGLPWWLRGKESSCNAGDARDVGLLPGSGRFSAGSHGNPFQYSCPENPMDRGAWPATVHGITESDMMKATEHVVSDSWEAHGRQPARLLCPWDYPRQKHCSQLPFQSSWDLLNPRAKSTSLASILVGEFFTRVSPGKPFPCHTVVKKQTKKTNCLQHRNHRRSRFSPWVGKLPWRRKCQPITALLTGIILWTESGGLWYLESQKNWT